ncbi:MAG TPA: ligase-associated DNA damage response endonuclease PdeM [Flavisolibacter sp.]
MVAPVPLVIRDQNLWLTAQRAVYWENSGTLIVSDLHFGKTGHFRKSGIPVPQKVYREDLQRLVLLLHHFNPTTLLVVGDFFHSEANPELDLFRKWRNDFADLEILLVRGNHDILHDSWYAGTGITLIENELAQAPFLFMHEKCTAQPQMYTFCGHIHPGVYIEGLGRQALRFPCFYFSEDHCVLPAFSKFTGMALVTPETGNKVFAIVENELIRIT